MNQEHRVTKILQVMEEVESSSLSVSQYFNEQAPPFGRVQYYAYKKRLRERGIAGLYDQRGKGNHLRFTVAMQNFVKGLLEYHRTMTALEVQKALKTEFGMLISQTVINAFRRENDLGWIRPTRRVHSCSEESGASEIAVALALGSGLIDVLVNAICHCIDTQRESEAFKKSVLMQKDHPELRSKGRFTPEYNGLPQVRAARFKPLDEKLMSKRFASMRIFNLSRDYIKRYTLALFSLPLVTTNGRVSSVDSPRGNALKYLCGVNYKAATLDTYVRELKYLQVSRALIEVTARFWIDFWSSRNSSESIFVCYYLDGNTKALWSSKSCHKGKVTMLGRVMNCLEQVFIHDGQGHPLYFQTFNGHADLGKNALKMIETISAYIDHCPEGSEVEAPFTVNRILIMDGGGNGVKTLRELSDSGYYFITMLDSNQFTDRKVKFLSGAKRYDYGDAYLIDCTVELEDSRDKGYLFETRAVQIHWDNSKTSILITSVPEPLFSMDNVVKSYFDRWPAQELNFKDMKNGLNIHRVVGYGKKLVENPTVLAKIERLQGHISNLEQELEGPLREIRDIERLLQSKISEERKYREKSIIVNGERKLSESDAHILKGLQKEIHRLQRKIKKIEQGHDKPFTSWKKKKAELARIIDKKKRYRVDMELDQLMTCFKLSFANICCYLLDECFHGEKMTLQRLFDTIFDLRGKARIEDHQRNIFIERNPKQEKMMKKLESAFDVFNRMKIKDSNGCRYNFQLV